jgi:Domain of unknown function (DUF4136)
MPRVLRLAPLAISAVALASCATTMNVSSHVDAGVSFAQYQSYDWGPADALPTGDSRLDKDPFFQDHVQGAVERELARKNYKRSAPGGTPDLLIHYHASINERIDVNRVDREHGYCYDDDCQARVVEYEAGTLVLDIVDSRTSRVIWRGGAQDSVESILNDQDRMARKIDEAVRRMLARFPSAL